MNNSQLSIFHFQSNKGFTLIELLIVIAIVALLGATATPFYSRFINQNNLEVASENVIDYMRKAQSYSMDGKDDHVWGVCKTGTSSELLRLYSDSCNSPSFSEDYEIPVTVTITGLSDVTFSKRRGEPATAQTITVTNSLGSRVITINLAGGMEIN